MPKARDGRTNFVLFVNCDKRGAQFDSSMESWLTRVKAWRRSPVALGLMTVLLLSVRHFHSSLGDNVSSDRQPLLHTVAAVRRLCDTPQ